MPDIFVHPSGQDDNLGDSALRVGLLRALSADGSRLHVHLEGQSSDYLAGIPLGARDVLYSDRRTWLDVAGSVERPVFVVNAGEINPRPDHVYPNARRVAELRDVRSRGGVVIAAGLGVKDPAAAAQVRFDDALREANVMSWRDRGSRDAVGFGDVAPDWAFALGTDSSAWTGADSRRVIAVTMRFDRPWPGDDWLSAVRALADRTGTTIVAVAQVARDAPRAVQLAEALGGEYLTPPSMRHDDLDDYVRSVYSHSLAVVSDRAHGLIMGATEGAYPLGTAADPQKIQRLLDTAGVGELTGHHDGFAGRADRLPSVLPELAGAVDEARRDLSGLAQRVTAAIGSAAA